MLSLDSIHGRESVLEISFLAPVLESASKTVDRIPVSSPYERRGPSALVENRQFNRQVVILQFVLSGAALPPHLKSTSSSSQLRSAIRLLY